MIDEILTIIVGTVGWSFITSEEMGAILGLVGLIYYGFYRSFIVWSMSLKRGGMG